MMSATFRSVQAHFPILCPVLVACVALRFAAPEQYDALRDGSAKPKDVFADRPDNVRLRDAINKANLRQYFDMATEAIGLPAEKRREYLQNFQRAGGDGTYNEKRGALAAALQNALNQISKYRRLGYIPDLLALADAFGPSGQKG
jgi:hypothetical protein